MIERDELLRRGCKFARHTQRKSEIDGKGKTRARREQGPADRVKDTGVNEEFAQPGVVMGDREVGVGMENGLGEGAKGLGCNRLRLGSEKKAGSGLILFRETEGINVVGRGKDPGDGRSCRRRIGKKMKRVRRRAR